jgi:hypothetical protein
VTGCKPIAILLQSISGVSSINPIVAFYDIHERKRVVLFFYFVPDTTRDYFLPPKKYETKEFYLFRLPILIYITVSKRGRCEEAIFFYFQIASVLFKSAQCSDLEQ